MIRNSLEWTALERKLVMKANTLSSSNSRDVRKMLSNIKSSISDLSKAEVLARRGKQHTADEMLAKVNAEIRVLEEYIVVAALIG